MKNVWKRDDDSKVYVDRGHEATLELELSKFDSLLAIAPFILCIKAKDVRKSVKATRLLEGY